ncbi:hypothetical protein MHBO_000486 [Bonamia ostreae]|uniref:Uncharacterized protein n=2 Tax=Bonamia ostreae TaxID=126728 RepID=A0ABV2AFT3_9EUKA
MVIEECIDSRDSSFNRQNAIEMVNLFSNKKIDSTEQTDLDEKYEKLILFEQYAKAIKKRYIKMTKNLNKVNQLNNEINESVLKFSVLSEFSTVYVTNTKNKMSAINQYYADFNNSVESTKMSFFQNIFYPFLDDIAQIKRKRKILLKKRKNYLKYKKKLEKKNANENTDKENLKYKKLENKFRTVSMFYHSTLDLLNQLIESVFMKMDEKDFGSIKIE